MQTGKRATAINEALPFAWVTGRQPPVGFASAASTDTPPTMRASQGRVCKPRISSAAMVPKRILKLTGAALVLFACRRDEPVVARWDAAPPESSGAKNALCVEQPDGCLYCEATDVEPPPALDVDDSRPTLCDPADPENCVEFCSQVAPRCALPWVRGPSCVLDSESAFRRALFAREAAGSPEAVVIGRVLDETGGRRLEGAHVRVWLAGRAEQTPLSDETTGKDGSFRLRLPAGVWTYTLRVSGPGKASELVDRFVPDRPDPRAVNAVPQVRVFRLSEELILRGKVVNAATGEPIADALVEATRTPDDAIPVSDARTATDGSFALRGLGARRYVLRASKFGWRAQPGKPIATSPPVSARVVLRLGRANVIRGVVEDDEGDGVANATIAALLSGPAGAPNLPVYWTTDGEGGFAQDRFAPGPYYIWARHRDMFVYPPEKVEVTDKNFEASVKLVLDHRGAHVTGLIRTQTEPLSLVGARVVLRSRSPLAFPRPAVAEVKPDGRFVVRGLLPGRYEIAIRSGLKPLAIVEGPRTVEVPIDPDSAVSIEPAIVVRASDE